MSELIGVLKTMPQEMVIPKDFIEGGSLDRVVANAPVHSLEDLHERLNYSEEEGAIFWKVGKRSGNVAGGRDGGKLRVKIDGQKYHIHRIIWAMHYNEWPPTNRMIDHIDGDGFNNHISNLRLATNQENQRNTRAKNYHQASSDRWRASLTIGNRKVELGRYDTEAMAALVVSRARAKYFGEFSTEGVRYR